MAVDERSEYERAASGYAMWPLAAIALVREQASASRWTRIHNRQALVFGLLGTCVYLTLLALPLVIVIADSSISTGATVLIYGIGLCADVVAAVALLVVALRYAKRAGRGELFTIPVVSPLADVLFRQHG